MSKLHIGGYMVKSFVYNYMLKKIPQKNKSCSVVKKKNSKTNILKSDKCGNMKGKKKTNGKVSCVL